MGKQKHALSSAILVGLGLAFLTRDKIEKAVTDFMQSEGVSKEDAKKALQEVLIKANEHRMHVQKEIRLHVDNALKEISKMAPKAKKPAAKKAAPKKAVKKTAPKKVVAKKVVAKKPAAKKVATKKVAAKKMVAKKVVAKKAPAKKVAKKK